jgi:hypothetical protein
MNIEYWSASISGANQLKSTLSAFHLDDDPHFINITLTMAIPQSIPHLEESYKVTTFAALDFHFSHGF